MERIFNSYYYTLSTISQVLAGVIALLGAFWIYQIDSLNKKFYSLGRSILRELGKPIIGESDKKDPTKEETRNKLIKGLQREKGFEYIKAKNFVQRLPMCIHSEIDQGNFNWIAEKITLIKKY